MIQRWHDYDTIKGYADFEQLPKGGYIVKILGVSVEHYRDNQTTLKLSCDIIEGEYTNFYAQQYKNNSNEDKRWGCNLLLNIPTDDGTEQDGWSKKTFRTAIDALEESNAGYRWNWNEQTLKGLIVGGLFNAREYEGKDGSLKMSTNLARFCSTDKIRSGNYKLPPDKLLKKSDSAPRPVNNEGFMDIPTDDPNGLPFA